MTTILCELADLPDPGAKAFRVGDRKVVVVRRDGGVFAYVDSCPHLGVPLEIEEDGFLDLEKARIICANHGALFEIESGLCVWGPCAGRSLEPYPIVIEAGRVMAAGPTERA